MYELIKKDGRAKRGRLTTVSYTHLDVYKRQTEGRAKRERSHCTEKVSKRDKKGNGLFLSLIHIFQHTMQKMTLN